MNITAVRTAVACPWQNGVAERWVGSCRRELLDHVIAINESHLKRLLASFVKYYHEDRTHCALRKQTPQERKGCSGRGMVVAWPRVGAWPSRFATPVLISTAACRGPGLPRAPLIGVDFDAAVLNRRITELFSWLS